MAVPEANKKEQRARTQCYDKTIRFHCEHGSVVEIRTPLAAQQAAPVAPDPR